MRVRKTQRWLAKDDDQTSERFLSRAGWGGLDDFRYIQQKDAYKARAFISVEVDSDTPPQENLVDMQLDAFVLWIHPQVSSGRRNPLGKALVKPNKSTVFALKYLRKAV